MAKPSCLRVACALSIVIGPAIGCVQGGCRDRRVRVSYDRVPEIEMEVLREGAGAPIVEGKRVELRYTVALEDGTIIIDTRANDRTHKMYVGDGTVIKGLDDGIRGMRLGEIRRLVIPPELGYGRPGYSDRIPANEKIIMEVELAAVN
jgi:FKBP-type peptidyl-prolyl cis-trans isomerase